MTASQALPRRVDLWNRRSGRARGELDACMSPAGPGSCSLCKQALAEEAWYLYHDVLVASQ